MSRRWWHWFVCWGGIFWVREGDQMVSATPGQSAAEIARLREKIAYLRNAIRNLIDGDAQ